MGSPNGLKGHIGIYIDEEDIELIAPGAVVHVGGESLEIRDRRRGDKGWQIAFLGRIDRSSVEPLRGNPVQVDQRRELAADEYWPEQLVGLRVVDRGGSHIGVVVAVAHGPQQDRLVIEQERGRFEVPFVSDLVPEVDLADGSVVLKPIDGLISGPESPR